MKVVHIVPHLGGGIGKALATISLSIPGWVKQVFLLLEPPIDKRHTAVLRHDCGASIVVANSLEQVACECADADVVQVDFVSHPKLFNCLVNTKFPPIRSVFWFHISGLAEPLIPKKLIAEADRIAFTSIISKEIYPEGTVINSGFGAKKSWPQVNQYDNYRVIYLGTVGLIKMHEGFFSIADRQKAPIEVWGEASEEIKALIRRMKHPHNIKLCGHTADPPEVLSRSTIFLYLLQPNHYGTGENALVEAMSLGLVPIVLNNPAESAIVSHKKTGFIANSIEEAGEILKTISGMPRLREEISTNARNYVFTHKSPSSSAYEFMTLWEEMLKEQKRVPNFGNAIGSTPVEWFLATQSKAWQRKSGAVSAAKGSLSHFKKEFPEDKTLAKL